MQPDPRTAGQVVGAVAHFACSCVDHVGRYRHGRQRRVELRDGRIQIVMQRLEVRHKGFVEAKREIARGELPKG
ncbi:hypothetical protein [Rhizobium nepotum]|uniref:hypothetical protein n=1 Tax=Rhizobium nepotum TaxID=1035271 RepID=UPI0005D3C8DB|nr:hypothetical protein [Rhizobium nepotum]